MGCVYSSICDLEDYDSQLGSATGFLPRDSAHKTQLLRNSLLAGTKMLLALEGIYLPHSHKGPA